MEWVQVRALPYSVCIKSSHLISLSLSSSSERQEQRAPQAGSRGEGSVGCGDQAGIYSGVVVFLPSLCYPSLRVCLPSHPQASHSLHILQLFQAPPCPGCSPSFLALVSQPTGHFPTASRGLHVREESDGPLIFLCQATGGSWAASDQPSLGPASSPGLAVVGNGGRRSVE